MKPVVQPVRRRFLSLPEVIEYSSLSRSTIFRWEQEGRFPGRKRLGPNRIGWDVQELEAWAESRDVA